MKTLLTAAGAALFFAFSALAENWNLINRTDEMTDEVSYILHTPGTPITVIEGAVTYTPTLIFRVSASPHDDKPARKDLFFEIETDGIRRGTSTVKIRFDSAPAEDVTVTASTDRRAGFFANADKLIPKLAKSEHVKLRFVTTLGAVRTTTFNTSGFSDGIKKIMQSVTQTNTTTKATLKPPSKLR